MKSDRGLEQLKLIVDSISDFISYIDTDERYVFVNSAYENWFKIKSENVLGKTLQDILGPAYSISKPHFDIALSGHEVNFETVLTDPQSHKIKVLDVQYIPDKDPQGRVRGVIVLGHDVTERKRTEEILEQRVNERTKEIHRSQSFLDSVIENIPNMIFVKDAKDLKFVRFNRAGEELIGVPRENMMGKNDYDFFPKDQADFFVANDREVLASGRLRDIPEEQLKTSQKGLRFLHTKKIPIMGSDGRPEYLLGISEDITEAKVFAEQRAKSLETERLYREAQTVNRIKDEFLAMLSHELRTPLNVICGRSELLAKELSDLSEEDISESVQAIYRNARIQTQIIDDLLDVSSIITGKLKFLPELLSPNEILQAQVSAALKSAKDKGVELKAEIESTHGLLWADPTRLNQIVSNLISNAIKFTPPGGTVVVRSFSEGDRLIVQVKDNGIGIDQEFLPYVFERFRQQDTSSTRKFGGLGLGLSIVRHLIELHGGKVKVDSQGKNQGSCFTIELPARSDTSKAPKHHQEHSIKSTQTDHKPLMNAKILVVEDSPDSRELLDLFLRKAGALVTKTDSAKAARKALETLEPDIIISDIGMPQEDGNTFMKALRKDAKFAKTPALALTAYVRDEEIERTLEAGFQAHIPKPVSYHQLIQAILNLFNP